VPHAGGSTVARGVLGASRAQGTITSRCTSRGALGDPDVLARGHPRLGRWPASCGSGAFSPPYGHTVPDRQRPEPPVLRHPAATPRSWCIRIASYRRDGDGGFLMNARARDRKRLGTAFVSGHLGEPRTARSSWKQTGIRRGRHFGTDFTNPDFGKLAEASGCRRGRVRVGGRLQGQAREGSGLDVPRDRAPDRLLDRRGGITSGTRNRIPVTTGVPPPHRRNSGLDAVPKHCTSGPVADGTGRSTPRGEATDPQETCRGLQTRRPDDALAALGAAPTHRPVGAHPPRERVDILLRAWEKMGEREDELAPSHTVGRWARPSKESKA